MKVADCGKSLREILKDSRGPKVLVPTMGALHEGHLQLLRQARAAAGPHGTVIVSIFVNPIQFDRAADLAAYPRPLEADLTACDTEGVDVVFAPEAGSMYFPDRSVTVTESLLSAGLCGAARPGTGDTCRWSKFRQTLNSIENPISNIRTGTTCRWYAPGPAPARLRP